MTNTISDKVEEILNGMDSTTAQHIKAKAKLLTLISESNVEARELDVFLAHHHKFDDGTCVWWIQWDKKNQKFIRANLFGEDQLTSGEKTDGDSK